MEDVIRGNIADSINHGFAPLTNQGCMLIKLKVTLVSGTGISLDSSDFVIISDGQFINPGSITICWTEDPNYPSLNANIAIPGTSIEGWIMVAVFIDDENPLLAMNINSFQPNLTDGIFFTLTPEK